MRWSYKIVHYDYKKEGLLGGTFLDESEIEQSLNEFGQAGWELVAVLEVQDGLMATLKQPLDLPSVKKSQLPDQEQQEKPRDSPARFLRPERPVPPPVPRAAEPIEHDAADDEEMPPEEEIPAPPVRPSGTPPAKGVTKRPPKEEENNGGVGSIRIE